MANRWQKIFVQACCHGRKPKDPQGKAAFKLLGEMKQYIIVSPPPDNPLDEDEMTYEINEYRCSLPEGIISVAVLGEKINYWVENGYRINTR